MTQSKLHFTVLFKYFAAFVLGCVLVLASLFGALAFGQTQALAETNNVYAYSMNGGARTNYTSVNDALNAGYSGKTIYMDRNWVFSDSLEIAEDKTITINMNGYGMYGSNEEPVIVVNENAKLTLTSSNKTIFDYDGYNNISGKKEKKSTTAGGLITGGYMSSDGAGGVYMDNNSTLTLDNVAVAGNFGFEAGGVYAKSNCAIYMKNKASIESNSGSTGGIYVAGDDVNIYMDNSKISYNNGGSGGGGLRSGACGTRIYMTNYATISHNYAECGGGLYFELPYFGIYSEDKTGSIDANTVQDSENGDGAGVYAEESKWHSNEGMISGVNITNNVTHKRGGGLYLDQHYIRVIDCNITGNQAKEGAGVYVNNTDNSIEGCTITGNYCASDGEGGGVFVNNQVDVTIKGLTYIKGNTRGKNGSADDVFLQETTGNLARAYILGGVDAGSSVGIRTGIESDRQIGKDISTYSYGTYFIDLDGYYVSHGTDDNGDLWQRKSSNATFLLQTNGEGTSRYKYNETVSVNGATSNAKKTFWYWEASSSTGLNPVSNYINDSNKYNETLTFTMPQNDVNVNAKYADRVTKGNVTIDKPVAGQALPTTATFVRTDYGEGPANEITAASIVWFEATSYGTWLPVYGSVAKYNATYQAVIYFNENTVQGFDFYGNISTDDIRVLSSGAATDTPTIAYVNKNSGALQVTTQEYKTDAAEIESVQPARVEVAVGTSARALEKMLPNSATVVLQGGGTAVIATDKSTQINWPEGLLNADNYVANPEGGTATYTMKLSLASSSDVPGSENQYVDIDLVVSDSAGKKIAAPTLTPGASTVNQYTGTVKLSSDLKLTLTAESTTEQVEIRYKIDGGTTQDYDDGIELQGIDNTKTKHTVEVWAQKSVGGELIKSNTTTATYYLDDTLQKPITVTCTDTALYDSGETPWTEEINVLGNLNSEVTITAPMLENREFSHWEWEGAPAGTDLASQTLTIKNFSLEYSGKIKAVYVPYISSIDLGISAPVAHSALASKVGYVTVDTCAGYSTQDIVKYLSDSMLTWTPAGESAGSNAGNGAGNNAGTGSEAAGSGTAAHNTVYTATMPFDVSLHDNVAYVIGNNTKFLVNGQDFSNNVYLQIDEEGQASFCVTFPATSNYVVESVDTPAAVNLSFEEACVYQADQDANRTPSWGLPSEVEITYACEETGYVSVEWQLPTTFNVNLLEAQTLTVTGTLLYPSSVDSSAAPQTVTATINVAAPETAATPTATVQSGTYKQTQTVELRCETQGATIYYTTDGTDPTQKSAKYTGAIEVASSTTIKARAYRQNMAASEVAQFDYNIQFSVAVNGVHKNYYADGATVTLKGETTDATKAFWKWSESDSTGLSPFSEYVADIYNPTASFAMPKNNVNLVAEYMDRTKAVTLTVDKPVAGQALASTATISCGNGSTKEVAIQWTDENGATATTAAYGAKYSFSANLTQDRENKLVFAQDISASNVTIVFAGNQGSLTTQSAVLDSTGRLAVTSGAIATESPSVESVEKASVNVAAGTTKANLLASLPNSAFAQLTDSSKLLLLTDKSQTISWPDGLFNSQDEVVLSEGESAYCVDLPLSFADQEVIPSEAYVEVAINVLDSSEVATPTLSPVPAVYNQYSGAVKLSKDLKLNISAVCSTEGSIIKYQLDGGKEQIYNDAQGIELTGTANDQAVIEVKVWAEKTIEGKTVTSDAFSELYVLDDTLNKTITLNCSDTAYYEKGETPWSESFTVTGSLKADVSVTAPAQTDRTFDHWEWEGAPAGTNLESETLTITNYSLDYSGKITAVYVPTITTIDIGIAAPKAHSTLAASAEYVKFGTAAESQANTANISDFIMDKTLTWTPTSTSKTAAHNTIYTASMNTETELPDGVQYNFSDNFQLLIKGRNVSNDAYLQVSNEKALLIVLFPTTGPYEYESLASVEPVELSFTKASLYQQAQDSGEEVSWDLPDSVEITYACGETGTVQVKWQAPSNFDVNKRAAQKLEVVGKLVYSSDVDNTGAPETITTTINVSAPTVETPAASVASGIYTGAQTVELSCATQGATIRYTTDGSDPTETSTEYKGTPITIDASTTLRVCAFANGMTQSAVATYNYTILQTYTVTFDTAGGSEMQSVPVQAGKTLTKPADPTREGYTFVCWTCQGEEYDFATPVTSDITLTATWKENSGSGDSSGDGDGGSSGKPDSGAQGGSTDKGGSDQSSASAVGSATAMAATGDTVPWVLVVSLAALGTVSALCAAAGLALRQRSN